MQTVYLSQSTKPDKKFMVKIDRKTVHFGQKGASDYTKHKNLIRKKRYENRHIEREDWSKEGIKTAGFWSKWILWNKPSLKESIIDTEKIFNLRIIYR